MARAAVTEWRIYELVGRSVAAVNDERKTSALASSVSVLVLLLLLVINKSKTTNIARSSEALCNAATTYLSLVDTVTWLTCSDVIAPSTRQCRRRRTDSLRSRSNTITTIIPLPTWLSGVDGPTSSLASASLWRSLNGQLAVHQSVVASPDVSSGMPDIKSHTCQSINQSINQRQCTLSLQDTTG